MVMFWRIICFPLTLLRFVLLILVSVFFLITVLIENRFSKRPGTFKFWSMRNWGKTVLILLGFKVNRNEINFPKQFITMPNHRSYIDIFLLSAYSPSVFVAKEEIKKWPIVGPAAKAGRLIFVRRNDLKSLLGTMNKIKQSISQNISVTVFPEGTTSTGPGLVTFKNGTFKVAAELNIPIIPCAISYAERNNAWVDDDNFISHFFRQMWRPFSKVTLRFGKPINEKDYQTLKEKTKSSIETFLNEIE